MYTFDYLVFIGRFQPFHLAHLETIQIALQQSRQVIIALGSAQAERKILHPNSKHVFCLRPLLMSMTIKSGLSKLNLVFMHWLHPQVRLV